MKRHFAFASALLMLGLAVGCLAADTKPTPKDAFKTKTVSVAIFKDGYGFFVRQGLANLRDGWCMTDFIPRATAGTFWLYTSEPDAIVTTVRSTARNEVRYSNAAELVSALTGKVGLQVKIDTEDGDVQGELVRVLEDMLLVKADKQLQVVPFADVKSVQVVGQPLLLKVEGKTKMNQATINMGYLQAGINWVPSYVAEFVGPNKLRLTLRGTITNGVEDLRDCTIYLVVGVPNFMLKGQLDPLTVNALGSAVLGAMPTASRGVAQAFSNAAVSASELDNSVILPTAVNVPIEGLKELYFYELKGLDVSGGDVVMATVMVGDVDCRSLYVWSADSGQDVYHYVVIKNSLASPLTTGPALVLDKGRPVSQDQLTYTSVGGESRLKLTLAGDVRADASEKEVERQAQEKIWDIVYIPVVSEGKLTVTNRKNEPVEVEVSRTVAGKVLEISDGGQSNSQTKAEDGLNPQTSLKWTVKVEGGSKRTLTYTYLRYVRARAA